MSETNSVYVAYQGNTYLFGGNAPYVEEMYENYLADPASVPDTWRAYFDALQHVPAADGSDNRDVPHLPVINAFAERAKAGVTQVVVASGADSDLGPKVYRFATCCRPSTVCGCSVPCAKASGAWLA